MSKKRDRKRSQECQCSTCQNKSDKSSNGLTNNPFGINPSQLMGMLGNIDIGQIGSLLSSMNKDGFDLNNLNLGSIQNMMSGMSGNSGTNGSNGFSGMKGVQNKQDTSSMQRMMSEIGMKDNQGLSSIQDMLMNMGTLQGSENNFNNESITNNSSKKDGGRDNIGHNKRNRNKENITDVQMDENIEMLMAIRKIVNYDKAKFIDKVIELYNNGVFEDQ